MVGPEHSDGSELFCPNCGNSASPDHDYCIHCGHDLAPLQEVAGRADETDTERGSSPTQKEQSSSTADDGIRGFRRRVSYLVSKGWEIEYDGHDEVVLVDRGIGSIWVHILLLPFTSGIGNLLYGWYHYSVSPIRVTLRADGDGYEVVDPRQPTAGTTQTDAEPRTSPMEFAGAVILLVIGVLVAVSGGLALFSVLFSLAFMLVGLYLLPPVRRRIRDRHSPATFGPTETVDERYVEKTDRPCTNCGSRVVDGVVREYKQESVFAGIPLYTKERGENYYCQACQRLETAHDTEASSRLDDVEVDSAEFEDSIERELERLRENREGDSSTPHAEPTENTETEQDSKTS